MYLGCFFFLGVFSLLKKVLIAVGDKDYTNILKNTFAKYPKEFTLSSQEVFHRQYLLEIVENEKPDILVVHDDYLSSSYSTDEEKEKEWLQFIRRFYTAFDETLRLVFLCERPRGDVFLSTLVSLGVRDIFNANSFDLDVFIQQLIEKPRFINVEKFLLLNQGVSIPPISFENEEDKEEAAEEKSTKTEKTVVQKVVNKNIIKRDYKIEILNQTEKVIGVPVKKKLIMVGSPLPRSGSSFISHLLARALTQMDVSVTYVENPYAKPYTYDRFIGHQKTNNYRSKFYEYSKDIPNSFDIVSDWKVEQVSLICKHPTHEFIYLGQDIGFDTWVKVLYSTPSTITIIDVGSDWNNDVFRDLYDITDHLYIVLEPDFPYIQYFEEAEDLSTKFLRELLLTNKTSLIGNRFTHHMKENEIIKELYTGKFKTTVPAFPAQDIFESQYQGIFLNDYKDYHKFLEPVLFPLLNEILPGELMKRQKSGLIKKLFGKKISIQKFETKGAEATE